jgi:ferric-dicitrate binding protein FerR (iron transport regulator)
VTHDFALAITPPGMPVDKAVGNPVSARTQRFSDGTTACFLKPDSEVIERLGHNTMRLTLVRGEVLSEVATNSGGRKVVVFAGSVNPVAVSTRRALFSVALRDDSVERKIFSGQITVGPDVVARMALATNDYTLGTIAEAGLRAVVALPAMIDTETHVFPLTSGKIAEATAWRQALFCRSQRSRRPTRPWRP